jgi:transcriptional regulator with XRE-family HTH domain
VTTAESALIGLRIAKLRKEAGLRQEDIATVLGLSRSSVANIETGRQELSASNLLIVAKLLGSAVSEITESPSMPWLELAKRTYASERQYEQLADKAWREHDYLTAIRLRGVAEGIALARQHHLDVVADRPSAADEGVVKPKVGRSG